MTAGGPCGRRHCRQNSFAFAVRERPDPRHPGHLLNLCCTVLLRYAAEGSDGHDWCRVCHTLLECRELHPYSLEGFVPRLRHHSTGRGWNREGLAAQDCVDRFWTLSSGADLGHRRAREIPSHHQPRAQPTHWVSGAAKNFSLTLHLRLTLPSCCGSTLSLCTLHESRAHARNLSTGRAPCQQSRFATTAKDVTRNATFQNCLHPKPTYRPARLTPTKHSGLKWLEELRQNAEDNIIIMLVESLMSLSTSVVGSSASPENDFVRLGTSSTWLRRIPLRDRHAPGDVDAVSMYVKQTLCFFAYYENMCDDVGVGVRTYCPRPWTKGSLPTITCRHGVPKSLCSCKRAGSLFRDVSQRS